jgi:hypothetical protein
MQRSRGQERAGVRFQSFGELNIQRRSESARAESNPEWSASREELVPPIFAVEYTKKIVGPVVRATICCCLREIPFPHSFAPTSQLRRTQSAGKILKTFLKPHSFFVTIS